MDLRSYINGKEYKDKMVQGIVVSEEYNETLDSATVILSQIPKINDLRPYDDFFIYEGEFKGYNKNRSIYHNVKIDDYKAIIKTQKTSGVDKYLTIVCNDINNYKFFNISIGFFDLNLMVEIWENYELVKSHTNDENIDFVLQPTSREFLPSINLKVSDNNEFELFGEVELSKAYIDEENNIEYNFSSFLLKNFNLVIADSDGIEENFSSFRLVEYGFLADEENNYYDVPYHGTAHFRISIPNENFDESSNIIVLFDKTYFVKTSNGFWAKGINTEQKMRYRIGYKDDVTITLIPYDTAFPAIIGKKDTPNEVYFHCTASFYDMPNENDFIFTSYDFVGFETFQLMFKENKTQYNGFYKHFLVDQYTEEMLNVDEDPNKIFYKYKIELFSETKKLETIQIPNFSVTQPQHGGKKKNIYSYIVDVVDMYSPTYKAASDKEQNKWTYQKKYSVDDSLKEVFENVYCPDFTLNNPNLRDVLAQLMRVADMIPYVEDDVIKAMDITQRKDDFDWNKGEITNIVGSRTSSNHCDNLKRTYSDALSQDNTAHTVEYIGFRNSSTGMLTLENLKLETRYPIYKINKMYMCYYKKVDIVSKTTYEKDVVYHLGQKVTKDGEMYECIVEDSSLDFIASEWKKTTRSKVFLCKQDITKLILQSSERNLISQDWTEYIEKDQAFTSIEDMAKYKFCTLEYNIGSNEINGFGAKMQYFENVFWDKEAIYIQNILFHMDRIYPFGIYEQDFFNSELEEGETIKNIVQPFSESYDFFKEIMVSPFSISALSFKSLVFQVDYNAFYNGTIYHSKDTDRDDIVINDNSSSSLTLLEQDGIHQKEKANRFGNKTIQISSGYKNINDLQPLGSVFKYADEDDVIIYHKQYSIFDNIINCSYSGSKDYVLKNYFTSVYAKHRPYNLMSYGESVRRSENRKMYINISKNDAYVENENKKYSLTNFNQNSFIKNVLSFYKQDEIGRAIGDFKKKDKINYGVISYKDNYYLSDINSFSSGNSICFNLAMYDNVSAGLYLDKNQLEPNMDWDESLGIIKDSNKEVYIRGTMQRWYLTTDDPKDGRVESLGFFVGHKDEEKYAKKMFDVDDKGESKEAEENITDVFFAYPKVNNINDLTNIIGDNYLLLKDNKEIIDMTFQLELQSKDLYFSNWMLKLSDMISSYNKHNKNIYESNFPSNKFVNEFYAFSTEVNGVTYTSGNKLTCHRAYAPTVILSIDDNIGINVGDKIDKMVYFANNYIAPRGVHPSILSYKLELLDVTFKDENGVHISAIQTIVERYSLTDKIKEIHTNNINIKFKKIKNFGITQAPLGKTWYCNFEITSENVPDSFWDKLLEQFSPVGPTNRDSNSAMLVDGTTVLPMGDTTLDVSELVAYSDYVIKDPYKELVTIYNTKVGSLDKSDGLGTLVYHKNLYLATSKIPLDKMSVYKQFMYTGNEEKIGEDILIDNSRTPEDVISVEKAENGVEQLVITIPPKYINDDVQSIQIWYLDNDDQRYVQNDVFCFVFGINLTPEDKANGYVKFNVSVLSTRDLRVFDESHKVIGKVKNVANSSEIETEQKYEEQQ